MIADWLMCLGALGLFVSLFLAWSHQLPRAVTRAVGMTPLRDLARAPTAWQVYSAVDVLLAVLAGAVLGVALFGGSRRLRMAVLMAVAVALAFAVHAQSEPPTSGVLVTAPTTSPAYVRDRTTAGEGEAVAITALGVAVAGVGLSLAGRR